MSALEEKLRHAEKGRRDLHNTIQARPAPRPQPVRHPRAIPAAPTPYFPYSSPPPPPPQFRAASPRRTRPRAGRSVRHAVPPRWQELKGSIRVFCRVRPGQAGAEQAN